MAHPLLGTERARHDIAQAFTQYSLSDEMTKFKATTVLPPHMVTIPHGTYPVWPLKQLMATIDNAAWTPSGHAAERAPDGSYIESDMAFTQATYKLAEHGLVGKCDENLLNHYGGSIINIEMMTAQRELRKLMVQQELRTSAQLFSTTRFVRTGDYTSAAQSFAAGELNRDFTTVNTPIKWSVKATAQPITDIFVAQRMTQLRFGYEPRTLIVNPWTMSLLRTCDQITSTWTASGAGGSTVATQQKMYDARVAEALNVDEIVVCAAVNDTTPTAVTANLDYIWGNSALLCKRCTTGDISEVGLGHTFVWNGDTAMAGNSVVSSQFDANMGVFVEDYYDVNVRARKMRVRHNNAPIVKYDIGFLITSVY